MEFLLFSKYLILILLIIIINNIQQISTVPLVLDDPSSLYNATDKLTVLNYENFASIVYRSKTAWLIEFYASWCGHCRSYANTYREIAINAWTWKTVVRIAAINCNAGNLNLCRSHGVHGYPTIKLIPPGADFDNVTKSVTLSPDDAKDVTTELLTKLGDIHKKYKSWPRFTPVNRVIFEELYARVPSTTKLLLVIAEKRDDLTGRQIMLDFSKYHEQLSIFRTTTDGILWRKFHLNLTDVPALFVILHNRTAERIYAQQNIGNEFDNRNLFHSAIQSYIDKTKSITDFDDHEYEEMMTSLYKLKSKEIERKRVKEQNSIDNDIDKNTVHRKVNMVDLELALSHIIRQEIPQMKKIQGEAYTALVQWLTVLVKYFPGREPVMNYLKHLLSKVNEQSNDFSGDKFQQIANIKTSDAYLPITYVKYQHCAGSTPQYRGYTCGLWLLFHTLTISQFEQKSQQINIPEIPKAIKGYIQYFFTCQQCRDNFMKETSNINQLNTKTKYEAVMYLWTIHNNVNKRLRGDVTEDPKYPKVQFPSKYLCPQCQIINANAYDVENTINFLVRYYSEKNIDSTLVLNESQDNENVQNRQDYIISKVESHNETKDHFNLFPLFPSTIPSFPLYSFIVFIVVIGLLRYRYCKAKRKRYTL
ncbi:unnamed protein product [Adineta steineri]|uniref:Sulfhydryl oxidase n=1 Tax=Adineta steineri TaxID=433720 RepID=A0A814NHT6_9BILA|nr:unnamed protein product [Adineta steineri]